MTGRERKVMAAGGAVIVASLLLFRVGPAAARAWAAAQDRLAADAEHLVRLRMTVETVDALADSAAAVRSAFVAIAPRVLGGGNAAEALASLSGHLNAVADRSRARLEGAEPIIDSTAAGPLRRVTLRANYESDMRGAAAILSSLDDAPVALLVSSLRIAAQDPASPDASPEILKSQVVVSGWYLSKGTP